MILRWPTLAALFTGWSCLCTLASASNTFENVAIARTIELGGALVHVKTTFAVKATSNDSTIYQLSFSRQEHEKVSFVEARLKGEETPLRLVDMGVTSQTYVFKTCTLQFAFGLG